MDSAFSAERKKIGDQPASLHLPYFARSTLTLVNSHRCRFRQFMERPHAADSIPRVFFIRRLAFSFVALQKAGDEKFASERREFHAAGLAVVDDPIAIVEIDDFNHGPRLRGE